MPELDKSCTTCSVERAIGIVGGKWKLYVIRILLVQGPQRYNGLLNAVDGISPKVLTENLRALEETGVIERIEEDNVQLYTMTLSGKGLYHAMHALGEWVVSHEEIHAAGHLS